MDKAILQFFSGRKENEIIRILHISNWNINNNRFEFPTPTLSDLDFSKCDDVVVDETGIMFRGKEDGKLTFMPTSGILQMWMLPKD